MTKFQKKISKISKKIENCLLIGEGFGFLEDCLDTFSTVFVISEDKPKLRVRNLIFLDDRENFSQLDGITHIMFDRENINSLEKYQPIWQKYKSIVIIEGNEPIGREYSKPLYSSNWNCTDLQGIFHIWEQIK